MRSGQSKLVRVCPFDNEQFAVGKLGYSTASLYPTIPRMPRTIIFGGPGGTRTHYQSIMSRRLIPLKLPALAWSARCYPKATSCEQLSRCSTALHFWDSFRRGLTNGRHFLRRRLRGCSFVARCLPGARSLGLLRSQLVLCGLLFKAERGLCGFHRLGNLALRRVDCLLRVGAEF